jgi:vancomycin resistance protein YoaR
MGSRSLLAAAFAVLCASGGLLGAYALGLGSAAASRPAVAAAATTRPAAPAAADATARPDDEVTLVLGDRRVQATWAELGLGAGGGADGLDVGVAVRALAARKLDLDRPPRRARLDLEARKLVPEVGGYGVDVYGSLARLEQAARVGEREVELLGAEMTAQVTAASLHDIDISHVLGHFSTKFSVAEKSRNHNLKLAASKLDGYILLPGQEFAFNDVVGARTEQEGYKIAHVITAGEMVDGLAGGTCQISTTLHGASFFAGLEIVKSTPHSRPSTYVTMGLDATVVYPTTDLKLRNPYDFPVVIHYKVARGEAHVEILGQERPYDKISFVREVQDEIGFDTVTREDEKIPVGEMVVEQEGFPGYVVRRYRKFYKDGEVVKTDKWTLHYRPVTEYVRMGINPDPNLPAPEQPKSHGPHAPQGKNYSESQ